VKVGVASALSCGLLVFAGIARERIPGLRNRELPGLDSNRQPSG
jgi:hypothetical protein